MKNLIILLSCALIILSSCKSKLNIPPMSNKDTIADSSTEDSIIVYSMYGDELHTFIKSPEDIDRRDYEKTTFFTGGNALVECEYEKTAIRFVRTRMMDYTE